MRINLAIATRQKASDDFYPLTDGPDIGGKINVHYEDGKPVAAGLDTPSGNTTHNYGLTVPSSYVTAEYQLAVLGLMGSVNVQCSSQTSGNKSRLNWGFQYNPNREDVAIADITGIDIGGHEYWWTLEEPRLDDTNKKITLQTSVVYVQQIFKLGNLNALFNPAVII